MAQAPQPAASSVHQPIANIAPAAAAAPDAIAARAGVAFKKVCIRCDKPTTKICKCHAVRFCGQECQRAGWAAHKALCQNPTLQDKDGLTPLHRTVLAGKKIEPDFLEKHKNVRDSFNGTVEDLNDMMAPLPPDDETDTGWKFRDADGLIKPLTRKQFHENTNMHYLDGFHGTGDTIVHLHQNPVKGYDTDILDSTDPRVQAFDPKKAPKTYMQKNPKMGWGVFAEEVIEKDAIICLAGGKLVKEISPDQKAARYNILRSIDSTEVSGKGTLINDGPPNCYICVMKNYKGLQYVPVIVALRKIEPGEELRIDYAPSIQKDIDPSKAGSHAVKIGHYHMTPQATQELERFCEREYFEVLRFENTRLHESRTSRLPANALLEDLMRIAGPILALEKKMTKPSTPHQRALLYYMLNTPYAFIRMHLTQKAKIADTRAALSFLRGRIQVSSTINYSEILDMIEKIHQLGDRKIVDEILKLQDNCNTLSFVSSLNKMSKDAHLSAARIRHYQTLSQMNEEIVNFCMPEKRGYGIFKHSEEKKAGESLNNLTLKRQFHTLPASLKKDFIKELNDCVREMKEAKKFSESQVLEQLLKEITS